MMRIIDRRLISIALVIVAAHMTMGLGQSVSKQYLTGPGI